MDTIKVILFIALLLAITSRASADERKIRHAHIGASILPSTPLNMIWYQDIIYDDSRPDVIPTSLDIYVPDPVKAKLPVVIFVHGGGMYSGDKAYYKDLAAKPLWFNHELGFIFVSVNYHLLPAGQYPTSSQDVANATAWVHEHIAKFNGDPEQLFLLGHSAGQTLVAHAVTDEAFLKKAGKQVEIVKGVVSVEGVFFDLEARATTIPGINRLTTIYGPDRELWAKASVINHVTENKYIPPFLFLHAGSKGGLGANVDSEKLAAALKAVNVRAEVVELEDRNHFTSNEIIGASGDAATTSIKQFLESLTKGH